MKVTKTDKTPFESASKAIQNIIPSQKKEQSYTIQKFGQRLVELRNERGLSQQQSAELIGISRNTLSMYERCERCASIDIAVNVAERYNVTLDYLFGSGYKSKEHNDTGLYEFGFSEESLDLLMDPHVLEFVDSVLSDPEINMVVELIRCTHYKPLINSYETNYISRLVSDVLYRIVVRVSKDAYTLRPMTEDEALELIDAVKQCIRDIECKGALLKTDYDDFMDCEDSIVTQLERIQILLEHSESYSLMDAENEGFQKALNMIAKGELFVPSGMPLEDQKTPQQILTAEASRKHKQKE